MAPKKLTPEELAEGLRARAAYLKRRAQNPVSKFVGKFEPIGSFHQDLEIEYQVEVVQTVPRRLR